MRTKRLKFISLVVYCLLGNCVSAQTIKVGQHRIDRHIYSVSNYGHNGRLMVEANSGLISRVKTSSLSRIEFPEISSKENIKSAFVKVLGTARINELIPEKYVLVLLYFDTNGKVLAVKYILNKNSRITLKEINTITTFIKDNISFKIPPDIEKDEKITIFSHLIRFNDLVD